MIDYKKFLDECQYGFELQESGNYTACVKYCTSEKTWWAPAKWETWTYSSEFTRCIEETSVSIDIAGYLSFYSGTNPDCNKFVRHHGYFSINHLDDYESREYDTIPQVDDSDMFSASKWLSVEDYKALIIEAIEKYIAENDDKMKNVQLYRERGAIFKECKHV